MKPVTVLTSADPGWDEARQAWNLSVDQQPAAVVQATSAEDVVAAVHFARANGLRVAAQASGHNAKPLGDLAGTLLIKTGAMRAVSVDAECLTVRAEAGALWGDVTEAAADHDLAGLAGSSVDVSVVGYTLGGGVGWLGRKYGLAANNVTAIEAVTADGRLVDADADHEPDLFWALRGGGGSFAVVTAIELRVFPLATVCAGLLWWPIEAAQEVLQAWRELTHGELPDEFTTTARLMRFPADPMVPEPVRGRAFTVIDVAHLGSQAEADKILAPLRALQPVIDTVGTAPARALGPLHMDPDRPVASAGDSLTLDTLPAEAVDELIKVAGPGVDTPLGLVELRHLGGEMRRDRPGNGALAAIDADYFVLSGGRVTTPESAVEVEARTNEIKAAMAPWAARQKYLNFTSDSRTDLARFWSPQAYTRLRQIKAAVDPDDRIRSNHPIPPAEQP
jgi:FAD/FMN-containing dehydrogenase